jgi:uncharacterized protein YdaU (DUF1376 family)
MNGLPYYKAYPRDFIDGTAGMPFELKGAYRLVIDLIYLQGGQLPDDARYISGLLGCSVRKWNGFREDLIRLGKLVEKGGFLTNYRAIIELEKLGKVQDKQRENASGPRKTKDLPKPRPSHTDTDTDTEKEEKKEAAVAAPSRKPARPTDKVRIPEGWHPGDHGVQRATVCGIPPNLVEETIHEFRAYWTDRRDAASRKSPAGWDATWRNHVERIGPQKRRAYGGGGAHPHGAAASGGRTSLAAVVARRQMQREADAFAGDAGWGSPASGDDGLDPFPSGDVVAFASRRGC